VIPHGNGTQPFVVGEMIPESRLVAQLMSESILLAGLGALCGALLAHALSRGLVLFLSSGETELYLPLGVDWRVFGFTTALALLTCLLFGLTPAIRATRIAPADAMRGGRGSSSTSQRHGLRRALVVSQIALSLVLLVGALLFGQSLRNLLATDTGFVSDGILVATVTARTPTLEPERRLSVFEQLREGIDSMPDVASAASVLFSPFSNSSWNQSMRPEGADSSTQNTEAWLNRVGPGYFATMQTPLLTGRDFDARPHLSLRSQRRRSRSRFPDRRPRQEHQIQRPARRNPAHRLPAVQAERQRAR